LDNGDLDGAVVRPPKGLLRSCGGGRVALCVAVDSDGAKVFLCAVYVFCLCKAPVI
jgi:hypothetical protein